MNRFRALLLASCIAGAAMLASDPASTQPRPGAAPRAGQAIAAVVNDDAISIYELEARLRLVFLTSGLPDTPEARARLRPQLLRQMIDERLQEQEAARLGVTVADAEIQDALRRIEQNNRMPQGVLIQALRRAGVSPVAFQNQIRATIAWGHTISRRIVPVTQITEGEIEELQRRIQASRGNTETLLSEIFLSVDLPENEDDVRATAQGIYAQLRRGLPFPAVALQFSQSASAVNGGEIGWVERGQLDEAAEAVISATAPGQITQPIRVPGGFSIYAVRQRRQIAVATPDQTSLEIMQLRFPIGAGADAATQRDLAGQVRGNVNGCDDLRAVARELRVPPPAEPQRGRLSDLPQQFRAIVQALRVGEASQPIVTPQAVVVLMVCRMESAGGMPNREQLQEVALRQRVDQQARRLLRDLRRNAFIEIRG